MSPRYVNHFKISRSRRTFLPHRRVLLLAASGLVIVALLSFAHASSPSQATDVQARTEFSAAFKLVRSASLAGATNAELSSLTQQLNAALRMMNDAAILDKEGRGGDAEGLRSRALTILNNVSAQATSLQAQAGQRAFQQRALAYSLASIMAGFVVLGYHYGLKAYRRYRIARTMSMRFRVNPNANKK
jgi:hypothetical protein